MSKPTCYLCVQKIEGKISKDNVPPAQFFATIYRKNKSPNLLTLPTHEKRNNSYQSDEDYFFAALAGLEENTQIHDWLIHDIRKKIWRDKAKGLGAEIVILVGLENDMVPDPNGYIEEEARLFYVSMTRAKENLFLFHSLRRERGTSFGNEFEGKQRSIFLDTLGIESKWNH